MLAIETCETCGYEIPIGERRCPNCVPAPVPTRAARQLSGLELPTRSVRTLDAVRPGREEPEPVGQASGVRLLFELATFLTLAALTGLALAWIVRLDRFTLAVPSGITLRIDAITTWAAIGAIVAVVAGLVGAAVWSLRWASRTTHRRTPRLR